MHLSLCSSSGSRDSSSSSGGPPPARLPLARPPRLPARPLWPTAAPASRRRQVLVHSNLGGTLVCVVPLLKRTGPLQGAHSRPAEQLQSALKMRLASCLCWEACCDVRSPGKTVSLGWGANRATSFKPHLASRAHCCSCQGLPGSLGAKRALPRIDLPRSGDEDSAYQVTASSIQAIGACA